MSMRFWQFVQLPGVPVVILMLLSTVLAGLSGCSSTAILDATIPDSGYTRTRDIAYGHLPRQKLDVYRPSDEVLSDSVTHIAAAPATKKTSPVVVFFYGGDWSSGSKEQFRFVAQALTSRGYVVVIPDYRLYPQVRFPAFVEDGAMAVRWIHEHASEFDGDPNRMFLMGHSSGAHIAGLLAMDAHYLADVGVDRQALIGAALLSGPYAFVPTGRRREILDVKPGRSLPDASTQVLRFVDGKQPPLLLIQGLWDTTVYPSNTRDLTRRIHERGGWVKTIYYEDRGHVDLVLSLAHGFHWLAPTLDEVTQFFETMSGGEVTEPHNTSD